MDRARLSTLVQGLALGLASLVIVPAPMTIVPRAVALPAGPPILVDLTSDLVYSGNSDWSASGTVTHVSVAITRPGGPSFGPRDAPLDGFGHFALGTLGSGTPYDIVAGDVVSVSNGSVETTHTVLALAVLGTDVATKSVDGTAPYGPLMAQARYLVDPANGTWVTCVQPAVPVAPGAPGTWTTSFTDTFCEPDVPFVRPNPWAGRNEGTMGNVQLTSTVDGSTTVATWRLPDEPTVRVATAVDDIDGRGWLPGVDATLTITDGAFPVYTASFTVPVGDPSGQPGGFTVSTSGVPCGPGCIALAKFDVRAGALVTIDQTANGGEQVTYPATGVMATGVDLVGSGAGVDTIRGRADPTMPHDDVVVTVQNTAMSCPPSNPGCNVEVQTLHWGSGPNDVHTDGRWTSAPFTFDITAPDSFGQSPWFVHARQPNAATGNETMWHHSWGPQLHLSKASFLADGETITVTGTGWRAGAPIRVAQCRANPGSIEDCAPAGPGRVTTTADAQYGDFAVQVPLENPLVTTQGDTMSCTGYPTCIVSASTTDVTFPSPLFQFRFADLVFGAAKTPHLTLVPASGIADGDLVTATLTDYPAGQPVDLRLCSPLVPAPPNGIGVQQTRICQGLVLPAQASPITDASGNATIAFTASRYLVGNGQYAPTPRTDLVDGQVVTVAGSGYEVVDCATEACVVVGSVQLGGSPVSASAPITFVDLGEQPTVLVRQNFAGQDPAIVLFPFDTTGAVSATLTDVDADGSYEFTTPYAVHRLLTVTPEISATEAGLPPGWGGFYDWMDNPIDCETLGADLLINGMSRRMDPSHCLIDVRPPRTTLGDSGVLVQVERIGDIAIFGTGFTYPPNPATYLGFGDGDGVPAAVENAGPHAGDGNLDGTLDSLQGHVTSLPSRGGAGAYVTVQAPVGTRFAAVATLDPNAPSPPAGVTLPLGLVDVVITGVATTGALTLRMWVPTGWTPAQYWLLQDSADQTTQTWVDHSASANVSGSPLLVTVQDQIAGQSSGNQAGVGDDDPAPAVVHLRGAPGVLGGPTATAQAVTTIEDTPTPIMLTGSDPQDDPLTYDVLAAPGHGTVVCSAASCTYAPVANYHGPDSFTFTVADTFQQSSPATVSITVISVNDVPTAAPASITTAEDTVASIVLVGTDVEGSPLAFVLDSGPTHGTLTGSGASRTYTPDPNYSGPDSFTYVASDAAAVSGPATVTITVTPVNDAPVARADAALANEDTPIAIDVLRNDEDVDGAALVVSDVGAPQHGSTHIRPDGLIEYSPSPNYSGADSFSYTVSDGRGGTGIATVAITIAPDSEPGQPVHAASMTAVASGAGPGATAALVNIAMVNGLAPGYITADRCAALVPGVQTKANGNHDVDVAIANLSVVPLDADGRFCIYNQSPVDLVADVQGWFAPPGSGGLTFRPVAPTRLLDTRVAPLHRPDAGSITRVQTGVAPGTVAVLVNLAMVDGAAPGYITADKCSDLVAGPQTKANGNHLAGPAIANLSVVPVDPDGSFCIFNQVPVNLVVDLQGSFTTDTTGLLFTAVSPTRVLDTRVPPAVRPGNGGITRVATGAPAGTEAVLVNLAMTDGAGAGYITADRCSALVAGPQTKASGNHVEGTAISNLSVVPVDADGSFCIYNMTAVDLVVDLQGTFSRTGALQFFPVTPFRAIDTR